MFVLDTNILSALMKPEPDLPVTSWIAGQPAGALFTTTVCQAEILAGITILPDGRRRQALAAAAAAMFSEDFADRVLPFDTDAATAYADLFAARRGAGLATAAMDLMIAAIAHSRGASVVTRDTGGFAGCGVTLVDPWATR